MTVAIKRENGDLFWFDAVMSFDRQLSGSVSKHPLESGAVITDHTTIDNEVITLSGVLSDADFNLRRPQINAQQAKIYGITNKQFMNNTPVTGTEGQIQSTIMIKESSGLVKYLPDSISQFVSTDAPTVTLASGTPFLKVMPASAVQGYLEEMFNQREQFVLLSFVNGIIDRSFENCVMTGLSFSEDPDSGDAVYPNIAIERVRYAQSTSVKIKKKVSPAVEKKAAVQQNKGKQAATGGTCDKNFDQNQAQNNAGKTSGDISSFSQGTKVPASTGN